MDQGRVDVGLIGSASAAVFYAAFDILAARGPFFTVDSLAKSVFRGMRGAPVAGVPAELDVAAVAWYSGLHIGISLIIGLIVVWLVLYSQR
ncbi:MAG: hypothetical protein KJO98_05970, partial [Rhodothermia bacterium]|nr:hypothetical protein [Rhodothermia bacterium]